MPWLRFTPGATAFTARSRIRITVRLGIRATRKGCAQTGRAARSSARASPSRRTTLRHSQYPRITPMCARVPRVPTQPSVAPSSRTKKMIKSGPIIQAPRLKSSVFTTMRRKPGSSAKSPRRSAHQDPLAAGAGLGAGSASSAVTPSGAADASGRMRATR